MCYNISVNKWCTCYQFRMSTIKNVDLKLLGGGKFSPPYYCCSRLGVDDYVTKNKKFFKNYSKTVDNHIIICYNIVVKNN